MSTKPENYVIGVLEIPIDTFWAYAQTTLPQGQFYTLGSIEVKDQTLLVGYSASSAGAPPVPGANLIEKIPRPTANGKDGS